ncbi:MAG: fimbrillin family protein [Bacteroidales bacterium]
MTALVVIMILGAGCSKGKIIGEENLTGELKITTNMEDNNVSPTKSLVTDFSNNTIGVFVDDVANVYNPKINSTAIVSTGTNSVIPFPSIYINPDATVYSWYPATADELTYPDITSTKSITLVSTDDFSATNQTDYLWATPEPVTKSKCTPVLTFNHALSKVIFSVTLRDNYKGAGELTAISLTSTSTPFLSGTGTLLIADGTVSGTSIDSLVYGGNLSLSDEATEAVALVAPTILAENTDAISDITIKLTIDGCSYLAILPVSTVSEWAAHTEYTYNITVNSEELTIDPVVVITDWTIGGNYDLDITIDPLPTANCYMITPSSSLEIPVDIQGNGGSDAGTRIGTILNPASVGILWEDTEDLISLDPMSSDKTVTITTYLKSGNAVIAAYSDVNQQGDILWSWHIWVTNYDPYVPFNGTTYLVTNSADSSYTFMDRNLGATTVTPGEVTTYGLYYQWGRKDPFKTEGTVTTADASSLSNAILNPSIFYIGVYASKWDWCTTPNDAFWGGALISAPTEKTIFDPCPVGWRVPVWNGSASPWSEFTVMNFIWSDTNYGGTYDGAFYPTAGYRYFTSGAFNDVGRSGSCWSGSPGSSRGYNLFFLNSFVDPDDGYFRASGYSVRCVKE